MNKKGNRSRREGEERKETREGRDLAIAKN